MIPVLFGLDVIGMVDVSDPWLVEKVVVLTVLSKFLLYFCSSNIMIQVYESMSSNILLIPKAPNNDTFGIRIESTIE